MSQKPKTCITIDDDTKAKLKEYGRINRIEGGLSGVIEHYARTITLTTTTATKTKEK